MILMVDRKGVDDFLPDASVLHAVFQSFDEPDQNILEINLVGGFQTNSQKAKWDEDASEQCCLCDGKDTREHCLLHCLPLKPAREEHVEACVTLAEKRTEWIYVPLPRLHDEVVVLRAFLQTVKFPEIHPPSECDCGLYRFFTDGGSKQPKCMNGRIATWAVIHDLSTDDSHRKMAADYLFQHEPKFRLFQLSSLEFVPGDQTVARAELFEVVVVVMMLGKLTESPSVEVFTDASYVCHVIEITEMEVFEAILHRFCNCDLILLLSKMWKKEKYKVTKVKSHRKLEDASDLNDLCTIAGNMCADTAVLAAYNAIPSDIRNLSNSIAEHAVNEVSLLKNHLN